MMADTLKKISELFSTVKENLKYLGNHTKSRTTLSCSLDPKTGEIRGIGIGKDVNIEIDGLEKKVDISENFRANFDELSDKAKDTFGYTVSILKNCYMNNAGENEDIVSGNREWLRLPAGDKVLGIDKHSGRFMGKAKIPESKKLQFAIKYHSNGSVSITKETEDYLLKNLSDRAWDNFNDTFHDDKEYLVKNE